MSFTVVQPRYAPWGVQVNATLSFDEYVPEKDKSRAIAKRIAANVRRARTKRGLTQEQLAERADLHLRSLQKIEGAERSVLAETLVQIRAALDCSWEELLGA